MDFLRDFFSDRSALFLTIIVFGHITFLTIRSFIDTLKANRQRKAMERNLMESEQRVRRIITDMERARKDLLKYFAKESRASRSVNSSNDR